jgi:hypothetical protein
MGFKWEIVMDIYVNENSQVLFMLEGIIKLKKISRRGKFYSSGGEKQFR